MTLTLSSIVDRVASLPQLPEVTLRAIRVINDPASTFAQIVEVVRFDPSITTALLRLANSADSGVGQRVRSIDEAVRLLGSERVMRLVLAAHMQTLLSPAQAGYGLPPGALWRHSTGAALAAQAFGRRLGCRELGLCFTVGLLHDIGKIVLNEFVAGAFGRIAGRVRSTGCAFVDAEQQELGFTHADIGALAAERWGLPEGVVRGIRFHHSPAALPEPDMVVDAIHLADGACLLLGIGPGRDGMHYRIEPEVIERHGLRDSDIEQIGAEILNELAAVEASFEDSTGGA